MIKLNEDFAIQFRRGYPYLSYLHCKIKHAYFGFCVTAGLNQKTGLAVPWWRPGAGFILGADKFSCEIYAPKEILDRFAFIAGSLINDQS